MSSEEDAYNELQAYTIAHGDPVFIHQHVVDAFAAQHADERSKPIGVAFALVGLYLHVEKGYSGRQVRKVHMTLGRRKQRWPAFSLPTARGAVSAIEVMAAAPGPDRDRAIDAWCASVWAAFQDSRGTVVELLRQHGIA